MAEAEKKFPTEARTSSYDGTEEIKEVQSATLADAILKCKPKPMSLRMIHLYFILLIATFCSCINGYDGSVMGGINGQLQYRQFFHFDPDKGTPSTGIVYAIYTIGNLAGSFAAGPATDFRGEHSFLHHVRALR
jgi:Sugar (and other) transporter